MTDAELVREIAQPLSGDPNYYDKLLELIGNARFVLLGEATHGTHEFYSERATITKRLIAEKGFSILAMEGGLAGFSSRSPLRARPARRGGRHRGHQRR